MKTPKKAKDKKRATRRKETNPFRIKNLMLYNVCTAFELMKIKCSVLKKIRKSNLDLFKFIPVLKCFAPNVYKLGTFHAKIGDTVGYHDKVYKGVLYRDSLVEESIFKRYSVNSKNTFSSLCYVQYCVNKQLTGMINPMSALFKIHKKSEAYVVYPYLKDYMSLLEYIETIREDSSFSYKLISLLLRLCTYLIYSENIGGFMHRDLHCNNIMIHPTTMDLKIIDLDYACLCTKQVYIHNDEYGDIKHPFNPTHDLRTLLISLIELTNMHMNSECIILFMYITQNCKKYIGTMSEPIYHDTYKECVNIVDPNFHPRNVYKLLRSCINESKKVIQVSNLIETKVNKHDPIKSFCKLDEKYIKSFPESRYQILYYELLLKIQDEYIK